MVTEVQLLILYTTLWFPISVNLFVDKYIYVVYNNNLLNITTMILDEENCARHGYTFVVIFGVDTLNNR